MGAGGVVAAWVGSPGGGWWALGGVEGLMMSGEVTDPEVPVSGGMVRMVDIVAILNPGSLWCEKKEEGEEKDRTG